MSGRLHACAFILVTVLASLAFADELTHRKGAHFEVICHSPDERIADQALKTAEAVWPVAVDFFAFADAAPAKPLQVHLLTNSAEYGKLERGLTDGKFRMERAFIHPATKSAYICIQPECSAETLRMMGLPLLTRRMIAQEAANLIRLTMARQPASYPEWLADGAAAWIREETMVAGKWCAAVESDPRTCAELLRARQMIDNDELPSVDRILSDDIGEVPPFARMTLRRLLIGFLRGAIDEKAFRQILKNVANATGEIDYGRGVKEQVIQSLGAEELKTLDERFRKYLRTGSPQWEEVFSSLSTSGDEWTQFASPDSNAIAWNQAALVSDEYTLEGEVKIASGQLNLLLGEGREGFLSVAFVAGQELYLFQFNAKDNSWDMLDKVKLKELKPDTWCRFRISIADDQLTVTFNKALVLTQSMRGRPMAGRWGLGAQAGSAGAWRGVSVK